MTAIGIDDFEDEHAVEALTKLQLRGYGQFLGSYGKKVEEISDQLISGVGVTSLKDFVVPILLDEGLFYESRENITLAEFVRTDNIVIRKLLLVLSTLCQEADQLTLEATTKRYPELLLYGDYSKEVEEAEGALSAPNMMSDFLPCLQEVSCFVERCYEVSKTFILELVNLYSLNIQKCHGAIRIDLVHFDVAFEKLGSIMKILIILDEIIQKHACILVHWRAYLRAIRVANQNPEKVGTNRQQLKAVITILEKLDGQILSGCIFQNCVEQIFDSGSFSIPKKQKFAEEFSWALRSLLQKIEPLLGEPGETIERDRLVGITGLCALFMFIFRTVDKKVFKLIFDSHKKLSTVHLVGDLTWSPTEFLLDRFPEIEKSLDKKLLQQYTSSGSSQLSQKLKTLELDTQSCCMQVHSWVTQMEDCLAEFSSKIELDLERRCSLLLRGLKYAYSINQLAKLILSLHLSCNEPMSKSSVLSIFKLVQQVKLIQSSLVSQWSKVKESCSHVGQLLLATMLKTVAGWLNKIRTDNKAFSEKTLDVISSLTIVESLLTGPLTPLRLNVLKLAANLSFGLQGGTFASQEEIGSFCQLLRKLEHVALFGKWLRNACDCAYIYWQRHLLSTYFDEVSNSDAESNGLCHIFSAISDIVPYLKASRHTKEPQVVIENFESEMLSWLKSQLIDKVSSNIETQIRLCIHRHLALDDPNPLLSNNPVNTFTNLLALPPLRFLDTYVNIKGKVEQYLECLFYNLTTVSLSDWKTYAEMRLVAQQKYGLVLVESYLPSHQLEQGLDVLEIMRNINVFVAQYMYNLNSQVFVEKSSQHKHLNTISIKHVANSLRTHGTGIMNTTVNYTYQFLKKKFFILSQFLYDEQIKSRLVKDLRFFKNNSEELEKMFPFEKAEKFHRGIRKLGLTSDGLSYLDQFRDLISQVGNAMGYVRLIRSGGLRHCAKAIQFIPDVDDILEYKPMCEEANLSAETVTSAECFDNVLTDLTENFVRIAEYFQLLVKVFSKEFRSDKNIHLRYFYVIVPALTINFVEHMIYAKEFLRKKTGPTDPKANYVFTDDGFAMGVAYILRLLDQNVKFDSLHWFDSVRIKYAKQKATLSEQAASAKNLQDEKLQQTTTLGMQRLDRFQQEFNLLYFAMSSARIFFQPDLSSTPVNEDSGEPDIASDAGSASWQLNNV